MGKTGLIHHVAEKTGKNVLLLYADILATENKQQFLNVLATSIASAVNENTSFGKAVWAFLKSLRPVVSFDNLTGSPQISIESRPSNLDSNVESLLRFLDRQSKRIVLAIDEFQQITNYPEKNLDAFLRSIYQKMKNLCFIFSGSKKHIMQSLFNDPSKPFYRSTQILELGKIPRIEYSAFIAYHFKRGGKSISQEIINEIIDWASCYTYYVQLLCSRIYTNSSNKVSRDQWQNEALNLLKENEVVFFNYREILTKHQWLLLKAIAAEGEVRAPTSKDFISKYSLGSSASLLRSLNSLVNKEMIYFDYDNDGTKYYSVYDLMLQRYLQNQ